MELLHVGGRAFQDPAHPIIGGDILLFARGVSAMFLDAGSAYVWLRRAGI